MADADPINVEDRATQRNLSTKGRIDSLVIGCAIRDLGIPIGDVVSSAYCRVIEPGRLAFGRAAGAAALHGRGVWPPVEETRSLAGQGNHLRRGSGFRIAHAGIEVMSATRVQNAAEVSVQLSDGKRQTARVPGRAPEVGVAVLELEDDTDLPPLHSDSDSCPANSRVGDEVVAIRSALGQSSSHGHIGNPERTR